MREFILYDLNPEIGRAKVEKVGKLNKAKKVVTTADKINATHFNNDKICKTLNNRERRRIAAEKKKNRPRKKVV